MNYFEAVERARTALEYRVTLMEKRLSEIRDAKSITDLLRQGLENDRAALVMLDTPPIHAVVEKCRDDEINVSVCTTEEQAEKLAVAMATESTGYSEDEIRQHLKTRGHHQEGDWGVWLANASLK